MMAKAAAKKGRPRKKRKGRIARPDLPVPVLLRRPPHPPSPAPERPRRTLRPRRRRRALHDFTDDEVEERGRRKLKLVLKLPNITPSRRDERCSDSPARASRSRRIPSSGHVSSSSSSASSSSHVDDEEEEEEEAEGEETIKPPKKRRIEGCDDGVGSDGSGDQERGSKNVLRRCSKGSFSGLSSKSFAGTPLPERKTLEAILEKLQKKDTYGVFAEPVDPEELPDYHDVIEHPMDFGTIRKKLASNAYLSFEQFEDDVFLICSNAMQYNAPDTIYFRQARSIQDMARQKFQKLRVDVKCAETAGKPEEKIKLNSMEKKPLMKSLCRTAQEPLVSDISSAATLASTGDTGTGLSMAQANGVEAQVIDNGFADGSSSLGESKSEKADELSARSSPAKLGQKPFVIDENRRATYNISEQQSVIEPDSMFDVYEGEMRQLVAVGLHAEYSYARSLARFSASLGPTAWEITSKRIEKALPAGVKFGRGWVGEFEPLQTTVLSFENHKQQQQLGLNPSIQFKLASRKDKEAKDRLQATQNCESKDIRLGLKSQKTTGASNKACNLVKERDHPKRTTKLKQGLSGVTAETQPSVTSAGLQQQKQATVNSAKAYTNFSEHVRPWHSTSVSGIPLETALQKPDFHSEAGGFRSSGIISWDRNNGQPGHLKQPEAVASQSRNEVLSMEFWGLSNGKATGNSGSCRPGTTLGFISEHEPGKTAGNFACGSLEQGINNHSRLTGLQTLNKPNISNIAIDAPKPFPSAVIASGRENTSAAAAAAARAWMSIGASAECKAVAGKGLPNNQVGSASLHKFAWKTPNSPSRIHEDSKARHVPQFFQLPNQVTSEESKVHKELVIFPQLVATDLKRFHGQSPWQGLIPQTQQKQSKDMRPPDLNINIGFPLPGSPVHQSSGILKDSQQPDLALQL